MGLGGSGFKKGWLCFLEVVLPTLGRLKGPLRFEVFFGDLMVKKQGGGCWN